MSQKVYTKDRLAAKAQSALDRGGHRVSVTTVQLDAAGKGRYQCESPYWATQKFGFKDVPLGVDEGSVISDGGHAYIDTAVRCRKCPPCLKARAAQWRMKAIAEISSSSRTWFGTMTLKPEEHYVVLCQASEVASAQKLTFEKLDEKEQFSRRHAIIGKALTKWLKRVRKQSGAHMRYMIVAERHKSGLPHYHCLIHEQFAYETITKRCLEGQWRLGHSFFKLVDITDPTKTAGYVAKYLTKSSEARVRASIGYGQTIFDRVMS